MRIPPGRGRGRRDQVQKGLDIDSLLTVDLTTGQIKRAAYPVSLARQVLGGRGANAWLLAQHVGPGVDPLGAENVLLFSCGLLTGTAAPSSSRLHVGARSPLTGLLGSSNERGEMPIAALVVLDERVIASAHTTERSEGRLLVHAEYAALEQADRLKPFPGRRRDAVLYTNLEPCLMCLGAAMSFQLGTLYYALESPSDGATVLVQRWQRDEASFPGYRVPQITGGLLRQESIQLFKRWLTLNPPGGPMWEWVKSLAALERSSWRLS